MSHVIINKGPDDTKSFLALLELIPKYSRALSTCCFKNAIAMMSPGQGSSLDLSVIENARSPFVVLALAESIYHEFSFVNAEASNGTCGLSHMYAQSLVDLELLRQYFVLQIRTSSSSGRRRSAKLPLMQIAVQHVRKLCIMISMRLAMIAAYIQMKKNGECSFSFESRSSLLRSFNAALGLLIDPTLPDAMLKLFQKIFLELMCLLQLSDCLYYIGEANYDKSVLLLAQCKEYSIALAKLFPSFQNIDGSAFYERSLKDFKAGSVNWIHHLCIHRQETIKLVFSVHIIDPIRAILSAGSFGASFAAGCCGDEESLHDSTKNRAGSIVSDLCSTNESKYLSGNHVEQCLSNFMAHNDDLFDRCSLLLVKVHPLPVGSSQSAYVSTEYPPYIMMDPTAIRKYLPHRVMDAGSSRHIAGNHDNPGAPGVSNASLFQLGMNESSTSATHHYSVKEKFSRVPLDLIFPLPLGSESWDQDHELRNSGNIAPKKAHFRYTNAVSSESVSGDSAPASLSRHPDGLSIYSDQRRGSLKRADSFRHPIAAAPTERSEIHPTTSPTTLINYLSSSCLYLRVESGEAGNQILPEKRHCQPYTSLKALLSSFAGVPAVGFGSSVQHLLRVRNPFFLNSPILPEHNDAPEVLDWLQPHVPDIAAALQAKSPTEEVIFLSKGEVGQMKGQMSPSNIKAADIPSDLKQTPETMLFQLPFSSSMFQNHAAKLSYQYEQLDNESNLNFQSDSDYTAEEQRGALKWVLVCEKTASTLGHPLLSRDEVIEKTKQRFKQFVFEIRGSTISGMLR